MDTLFYYDNCQHEVIPSLSWNRRMESEWRCLEALDVQGRWFTFTQVSLGVLVLQLFDLRCKVLIIITAHSKSKSSGD